MAGTVVLPARCEASQRRSPVMSWKRPEWGRTVMGWTTPETLMDSASSLRAIFVEVGPGLVGIAVD